MSSVYQREAGAVELQEMVLVAPAVPVGVGALDQFSPKPAQLVAAELRLTEKLALPVLANRELKT